MIHNLFKKIQKGKKAVFFTFAAIFIIIILISIITARNTYRYRERSTSLSTRIMTMDNFITDFEKDMDRELYIGGYRALISVNTYLRLIQGYVPDVNPVFSEILVNGTANGTTMDIMRQDGQGADVTSWLARVNNESSKINIKVALHVNSVTINQTSPWNVTIYFNTTVNISDIKSLASWTFTKVYTNEFPILGFEDPLYVVATSDRMTNTINITPYNVFVANGSAANLADHLSHSYYVASGSAPTFLMRFTGNLSPSANGIESMVNLQTYAAQFGSYLPKSVIDWIYFTNINTTGDRCNVGSMPSWFRIDSNHTVIYQIQGNLNSTACP